ncbi:MAG TPA: nucleoside-diphosphate kinase [Candidatus Lokiarchaeia archaeon]|nr:nucleoside-diphosphate kinase [Candidatus Lokiarchaeia archaeon]
MSEISLVFLKPEVAMQPAVSARIIEQLLQEPSLELTCFKQVRISDELAREHYAEHAEKPFFPKLLAQVESGPIIAMIFRGEGAVSTIRELCGATFVENADPTSLRGNYGIIKGLNAVHASDSPESGEREVMLWKEQADLEEDASAAQESANAYVTQWKDAGTNTSPTIRALCTGPLDDKRRAKIRKIFAAANIGTDVTPQEIENIIDVIDTTLNE